MNDVIINKIQSIQRCIERAREEYGKDPATFRSDLSRQDAAMLNVVRVCELSIDLANVVVRLYRMGIPTSSAESFELIQLKGVIPADLSLRMQKIVGFRNLATHDYLKPDLSILENLISTGLSEVVSFCDRVREFSPRP